MKDIIFAIFPYFNVDKIQSDPNYLVTVIWVLVTQSAFAFLWIWLYLKLRKSSKSISYEISSNFIKIEENPTG